MHQQKKIMIIVGVLAVVVIVLLVFLMQSPASTNSNSNAALTTTDQQPATNQPTADTNQPSDNQPSMDTLGIETIKQGSGPAAKTGDTATVHYTGTLTDGTKFDSSRDRGTPFSFTLGENKVIQGWEQGVLGMKVGEERKLTIPSSLGYGDTGYPPVIPPKATLLFDIELLSIK